MSKSIVEEMCDADLHTGLGEFSARSTVTVADLIAAPLTADTWPSEHESTPIGDAISPTPPALPKDFSAVWDPESPAEKAADSLISRFQRWFR